MAKYVEYSRGDLITIIKQQQAEIDDLKKDINWLLYSWNDAEVLFSYEDEFYAMFEKYITKA